MLLGYFFFLLLIHTLTVKMQKITLNSIFMSASECITSTGKLKFSLAPRFYTALEFDSSNIKILMGKDMLIS